MSRAVDTEEEAGTPEDDEAEEVEDDEEAEVEAVRAAVRNRSPRAEPRAQHRFSLDRAVYARIITRVSRHDDKRWTRKKRKEAKRTGRERRRGARILLVLVFTRRMHHASCFKSCSSGFAFCHGPRPVFPLLLHLRPIWRPRLRSHH